MEVFLRRTVWPLWGLVRCTAVCGPMKCSPSFIGVLFDGTCSALHLFPLPGLPFPDLSGEPFATSVDWVDSSVNATKKDLTGMSRSALSPFRRRKEMPGKEARCCLRAKFILLAFAAIGFWGKQIRQQVMFHLLANLLLRVPLCACVREPIGCSPPVQCPRRRHGSDRVGDHSRLATRCPAS